MSARLDGRTALVTGSTTGLGRAMADAMAAAGAHVVLTGRSKEVGERAVAELREAGHTADYVAADLAEGRPAALRLADEAESLLGGRVDILVNNAGIVPVGPTADLDEELYDRAWTVNVKSAFFLTARLAPAMAARGAGVIINTGSIVVRHGFVGSALYSATKAAIESLTMSWAAEFGPSGVRVNAIAPGFVATETSPSERLVGAMTTAPAGRPGRVEEIGPLAVYLAGDDAAYVHGASFVLDGGWTTARR
ncbi:SDR family NAD(P)-dependent oxidoreductase [Actinoallomurus iriomotensis]|uniref:Dehydrogenase n=1 Tax=Actinoallomurus iriomotensis TaxID=478107 RepID=A0A9W6VYT0_9ACTN|nr:SDR family NAD(P)-dependent oxidoreductase [Actinoallomurus iriomotensis]GLY90413.1 dehydrogenase [Actinoallomurus iriomotensis]